MKTGFIGTGNMGGAILKGYSKKAALSGSEILAYDADPAKLMEIAEKYRVYPAKSPALLVAGSDIVILGLKPDIFEKVMPEISEAYTDDKVVVSMAAGVSISFIEKYLGQKAKVIRIMPNTPALIGQGMTAVAKNGNVDDELFSTVMDIFDSTGKAEEVTEDLMDCVTALSGSSPAYAYMFIEALVSAAEKNAEQKSKINNRIIFIQVLCSTKLYYTFLCYSIITNTCPFFIASPSFINIFFIFPEIGDFTSFISFIASTIHKVCPSVTLSPSFINGSEVGDGAI